MNQNLCRICLVQVDAGIGVSSGFFNSTIWDCIADLASISEVNNDNFPQEICQKCFGCLGIAVQLREKIIASHNHLRSMISGFSAPYVEQSFESKTDPLIENVKTECDDWIDESQEADPDWPSQMEEEEEEEESDEPMVTSTKQTVNRSSVIRNCTSSNSKEEKDTLMPRKEQSYSKFMSWCENEGITEYTEPVLLNYFKFKAKEWKLTTIWSHFSFLRSMLLTKNNVDIGKCTSINEFLRELKEGYEAKRSKIFTLSEINKFVKEAPDDKYLMLKVYAIIGFFGKCKREELFTMTVDNIEEKSNDLLMVTIRNTKAKKMREFIITGAHYIWYYKKYIALRPDSCEHDKLFVQYVNGKCMRGPVGINAHSRHPSEIAAYLNLPEPKLYTGHCFGRMVKKTR